MSNLQPGVLVLDKGLNLQTAKIVAPPGSVLDSLNYEQVDFQGQKRIDGYTRYDGKTLSAIDEYYVITTTTNFGGITGDLVGTDNGLLGVCVGVSDETVYVAVINNNILPEIGETLYVVDDGVNTLANVITDVESGTENSLTADAHYANLIEFNAVLRTRVEELPGAIIGLHWFRDRLYAVADVLTVSLSNTVPQIFPNDELVCGGDTSKVLDVITLANTRVVFLASMNTAAWAAGNSVTRDALSVGTVIAEFQTFPAVSEVASFFESRSEAQTLEEDSPGPYNFGWRFVDQGWSVDFENGVSLFGSLPSLNQNIEGLGTQGPTGVTSNNGAPLALLQKVDITNKPTQANGWKTSDTPTSYNLDPLSIRNTDTDYIYADAYVSWDGTTGEVSAPGLTSATVPEYAADATVEIEL